MSSERLEKIKEATDKYVEFLKERFSQKIIDWTPDVYINNAVAEFTSTDNGAEIIVSEKSTFSKKPLMRIIVLGIDKETLEDCDKVIEDLKPKFDIYTIVIFVSHESPKEVIKYVETYNHDKNSLLLIEPNTDYLCYDTKAATLPYTKWFDPKSEPKNAREVIEALEKDGKIDATSIREHFNFAYLQALKFLDSCKFLKREGYSDIFYLK